MTEPNRVDKSIKSQKARLGPIKSQSARFGHPRVGDNLILVDTSIKGHSPTKAGQTYSKSDQIQIAVSIFN